MVLKYYNHFQLIGILLLTLSFIGCYHTGAPLNNAPAISIDYCSDCERRADVLKFESKIESDLLFFSDFRASKFASNNLIPIGKTDSYNYSAWRLLREVYQRKSVISSFNEFILYWYDVDKAEYYKGPSDTIYNGYFIIEFNCGTEPFGYDTTKANIAYFWEGRYPGLTPVRDVPLDSFKLGYYSIVKWLYAQETDRYKVKRKEYEQFDHDYGPTASIITSENLVLEDLWQKEFLFTTYELIDTQPGADKGMPIITIVPYTLAPIHLYEMRPLKSEREKSVYKPDKYHINVADMAIRVYRYPTYEEMQKH